MDVVPYIIKLRIGDSPPRRGLIRLEFTELDWIAIFHTRRGR